ncbi:hypothetical protein [Pseudomonas sp. SMN5]|uniref:hypothetical protein n=1 Tax=Pseudomonas sp. SMN5 TaxID=3390198 RepID=UPI003F87F08B
MKILINFAGWFGQSNEPGNTLCIRSKAVLTQDYLETIEGIGPFLSVRLPVGMADRRDVFDPELTFSLVLTARMVTDRILEGKGVG